MALWCAKNGFALELQGSCGFGRDCVGILRDGKFPDYQWYDMETFTRLDKNGDVWIPPDAYHKHECVAVLGHGEAAESQLYDWLKWFDDNGFVLEHGSQQVDPRLGAIAYIMGMHHYVRLVRKQKES